MPDLMGRDRSVGTDGRYRLLSRITEDRIGSIWQAEDTGLHRHVAVEILPDRPGTDRRFQEAFRRSIRASRLLLSHPNIVQVYHWDEADDQTLSLVVMEPLEGETLAQRLRRQGPLDPAEAIRISSEVAEGVEAAHRVGIVHGDLTSDDVILTEGGGVKIVGFGVAPAVRDAGNGLDPRTDVRSLSVLMLAMLTGSSAADGAHQVDPSQEASRQELLHLSREAIADDVDRPSSASEFASRVRGILANVAVSPSTPGGPRPATRPAATKDEVRLPGPARTERKVPRRSLAVAAAVGAVAVGLAVVVPLLLGGSDTAPTQAPATAQVTDDPTPTLGSPTPTTGTATDEVAVPSVLGLSTFEAWDALVGAGLRVGSVVPVEGSPGVVIRSEPQPGAFVAPDTSVTLFVGAPPERL